MTPVSLLRQQALINGVWCDADSGECLDVVNPATGHIIGSIPAMGGGETRAAIAAAAAAWPGWKQKTAGERGQFLRRWYGRIINQKESLARLMTQEQGKPLAESRDEISYAASFVEWFSEEAKRAYGDTIPAPWVDSRIVTIKQPIGVAAAITPWNFPAAMVTRKVAPALAAGCPVVLKPSELTPFTALALAALAVEEGLPPGVLNVITGPPEDIGHALCADPLVRKLSFTGSTAIGKRLIRQSADTVKRLSLELGGNAPFVVLDDADPEAAVAGFVASKFRNAGQTCICADRLYVQAGIAEDFTQRLVEAMNTLTVGDGMEEGVLVGPLIEQAAVERTEKRIQDALDKGAQLIMGGKKLSGCFFEPTLLSRVHPDMAVVSEETFAPIAALTIFEAESEVVTQINQSPYGLAGYVYGRDMGRVWPFAEALECGMVAVNRGSLSCDSAPFGGVKQSGFGREGGRWGLEEFQEIKYLCLGGLAPL